MPTKLLGFFWFGPGDKTVFELENNFLTEIIELVPNRQRSVESHHSYTLGLDFSLLGIVSDAILHMNSCVRTLKETYDATFSLLCIRLSALPE